MTRSILFIGILCAWLTSCSEGHRRPSSPDGRIRIDLEVAGAPGLSGGPQEVLTYTVFKEDRVLVGPSPIELQFRDQPPLGGDLDLRLVSDTTVDETWEPVWGKTGRVRDHYNEYLFRVNETRRGGRTLQVTFRLYDDGVAFRYGFPEGSGFGSFFITEEKTGFALDPSSRVWATDHRQYYSSQEHEFNETTAGEIGIDALLGCPLLVEVDGSGWLLITEADLTDWAGLYFRADSSSPGTLVSSLSPLRRDPGVRVEGKVPMRSPWRVIMVGNDPGDLIESNLIASLNDPVEYRDVDWIKPGVSAWDRWWSGDYGPDAGFQLGMNTATMKYFIDLADDMDWEYMIVDWTWYGTVFIGEEGNQMVNPDVDITRPIDEVDIEAIVAYAGERDVKIILWVHSAHLDRQMEEALAQYEKWGVAGIKVDFMDCEDQEMVNWYHTVARKAAAHHLVVDFHGAYKPTGVSRTLPNLLTREGVLGNEYNKWSDRITPKHTVTLPYTRGVLGEMDFTPGGFHHIHRADFVIVGGDAPNPYVMGTRCHQLAMPVVYESALTVICDSPYNYRDQPGSDFLKLVPATWDETRYIAGYPGEDIVLARRSGTCWFIGGMTGEDGREVAFPLDFLGEGTYRATLWRDAGDTDVHPAHLDRVTMEVDPGYIFRVRMERGGGFVMMAEPV
jgi:alpha-glucosidase